MADAEVLALLDHIKDVGERTEKKLDLHITRDEDVNEKFLLPVYNDFQQRQGAAKTMGQTAGFAGYFINAGIAVAAAWAAVKALK